eukprot:466218-Amphidinium_carterae.2
MHLKVELHLPLGSTRGPEQGHLIRVPHMSATERKHRSFMIGPLFLFGSQCALKSAETEQNKSSWHMELHFAQVLVPALRQDDVLLV